MSEIFLTQDLRVFRGAMVNYHFYNSENTYLRGENEQDSNAEQDSDNVMALSPKAKPPGFSPQDTLCQSILCNKMERRRSQSNSSLEISFTLEK